MKSDKLAKLAASRSLWIAVLVAALQLTHVAASEPPANLYKSVNHGASWFAVGKGLPVDIRIKVMLMFEGVAVAGTDRGIYLSHDSGESWRSSQPGVGTEARILCLAAQDRRIFAGTHKHGVLSSDEAGATWKPAGTTLADLYVRSLLTVSNRLYAGTDRQGVFVSENGGVTWNTQRNGLPGAAQVFDLASVGGTVFAGLYSQGLYRLDNARAIWLKSGEVLPLEVVSIGETLVVGHNPGGVFVSEDQGITWSSGNAGLPVNAPVWTLSADDERVFVGTSGKIGFETNDIGLFVSTNSGKSWIRSDAGMPPSSAAICFLATKNFVLAGIAPGRNAVAPSPR